MYDRREVRWKYGFTGNILRKMGVSRSKSRKVENSKRYHLALDLNGIVVINLFLMNIVQRFTIVNLSQNHNLVSSCPFHHL
jgi:hypothetical protein